MTKGEGRNFTATDIEELGADVVFEMQEQDAHERFMALSESAGQLALFDVVEVPDAA
jgi:hypothetical protein